VKRASVTTESVLQAATDYVAKTGTPYFTTHEIAEHLGKREYMVRSAMGWLKHFNLVEPVPTVRSRRRTKTKRNCPYWAVVYQIREKSEAPDFQTLHMVFCCGR
jgi:Winged helix-turn-helix transcription repressor, HrcA DNA-binding